MPVLTERSGVFTRTAAASGIEFNSIPGSSGAGILTVVAFMVSEGFDPNDPTITIQMFPSNKFTNGSDINGDISVTCTFTVVADTDFLEYGTTGPAGNVTFDDGIDAQRFRAQLNSLDGDDAVQYVFQIQQLDPNDPLDWPGSPLSDQVENIEFSDIQFDPENEIGSATISFDWNGTDEIDGFLIEYEDEPDVFLVDSAVKHVTDQVNYQTKTFTFVVPATYCMRIRTFRYSDLALGIPTECIELVFPDDGPDISITGSGGIVFSGDALIEASGGGDFVIIGSGGIALGGAATIQLTGDPSGIYTLVPGKRNDTLYLRNADEDTEDVKIPDPFFKLGIM